ncbi:2-aminoadipate transaminase [Caulifigura coniformis]|uniref:2-aminoadipate transaminase n=1 Tax=Caulifigura coniformis TaxID=2527983 RepID=A0A517SGH3_9PLAN|nr:PLP-dependent aminotransferase family protein [Caulifigura coniformis]QDT55229.1 2-aminoadipate transaminase [Caulifigura coniformis]
MSHVLHTSGLSQRSRWAADQAISFLMQQGVENPGCISLAAGLVDEDSLPAEPVRETVVTLLSDSASARSALQYGTTQGRLDLRGSLLDYMAAQEGVPRETLGYDASRMVVTTGSQQLLSLLCETLLDPGDICIVGAPTYFVFLGCLAGVGAEPISVPLDENGMQPELLEQALARLNELGRLPQVKMIYVVSEFDNPSGVSVSLERRKAIVDIANRWSIHNRILILEDAAYRDLRFDGNPLPSLLALDGSKEQVLYTQTFSKTLSPGLRVGFGVLPKDVMKPVLDRKGNEDFGSANFPQAIVTRMLKSGAFQEHVRHVRDSYTRKRDAMLAAAEKYFADIPGVTWRRPSGGLYVWMSLPASIPTGFQSPLFQAAVKQHGVMYVPGELCFAPVQGGRPKNHMRLSYGVQTPEGITDGMWRLSRAVKQVLAG